MSLSEFINKYNGKKIDFDGYYGAQCMDLMHFYIVEVLGLGRNVLTAPTAFQAYQNGDGNFEKLNNTSAAVPQAGDIIFWNTKVGPAGHAAVFVEGDVNSFRSFDQNWPVGAGCHIQNHNYFGVAGWLRPKKGVSMQAASYEEANIYFQALLGRDLSREEWEKYHRNKSRNQLFDELRASAEYKDRQARLSGIVNSERELRNERDTFCYPTIEAQGKQIADLKKQVEALTKQVTDLQTQVAVKAEDSVQLNALGALLKWLIKRLGLK